MKIGNYEVPDAVLDPYVKHVVDRWLKSTRAERMQSTIDLERERERLHNIILDAIGLTRGMGDYNAFEKALEDYCDSMLPVEQEPVHRLNKPGRGY